MTSIPTNLTRTLNNFDIDVKIVKRIKGDAPALTSRNHDGSYTILLNNQFSFERLQEEYLHELKHIEQQHFELVSADEAEKLVRSDEERLLSEWEDFIDASLEQLYLDYLKLKREVEAIKEVNNWIEGLKKKEHKRRKRKKNEFPDWMVESTRKKLGIK